MKIDVIKESISGNIVYVRTPEDSSLDMMERLAEMSDYYGCACHFAVEEVD